MTSVVGDSWFFSAYIDYVLGPVLSDYQGDKIIAAADVQYGNDRHIVVLRYEFDASEGEYELDPSFGYWGFNVIQVPSGVLLKGVCGLEAASLSTTGDRIYVAGKVETDDAQKYKYGFLARFDGDGNNSGVYLTGDTSFDNDGWVITDSEARCGGIAVDEGSEVAYVGCEGDSSGNPGTDFTDSVWAFETDGGVDSSFGYFGEYDLPTSDANDGPPLGLDLLTSGSITRLFVADALGTDDVVRVEILDPSDGTKLDELEWADDGTAATHYLDVQALDIDKAIVGWGVN